MTTPVVLLCINSSVSNRCARSSGLLPWLFSLLGGGVEDAGQFQTASGAQGGCFDVEQFQLLASGGPMAVADGEWDEDGVGLAGGHGWKSPGGKCKSPCGEGLWGGEKKPLSR